jgi:hypothetical protein
MRLREEDALEIRPMSSIASTNINNNSGFNTSGILKRPSFIPREATPDQIANAARDINYWKKNQDPITLYNLEGSLEMSKSNVPHIREITRFYKNDIKGHKRSKSTIPC